jgi:hypothetical protein
MTELEEAELTDGQGRALSGHKTAQAYRGYLKETMMQALAATRKRHAHLLVSWRHSEQCNLFSKLSTLGRGWGGRDRTLQ